MILMSCTCPHILFHCRGFFLHLEGFAYKAGEVDPEGKESEQIKEELLQRSSG